MGTSQIARGKTADTEGILNKLRITSPFKLSLRLRLWLGTGVIAVFIGILIAMMALSPTRRHLPLGLDFMVFYSAGTLVDQHDAVQMYDLPTINALEHAIATNQGIELGDALGPWWNPPFYAWVFVPFSHLPFGNALTAWVALNVICALAAVAILCRMLISAGEADGLAIGRKRSSLDNLATCGLVPALLFLSIPFIYSMTHGQNACMSLLLMTITVALWRNRRAAWAGAIAGLLLYKPQLALFLSCVLVLDLGWRALVGLGITGAILLAATLALPGTLGTFVHQTPLNLHIVQEELPYIWTRHVTFLAFWRVLLQGTGTGATLPIAKALSYLCMAGVGIGLLLAARRNRGAQSRDGRWSRDRLIAATIAAAPLLTPFYFDYDQVLLLIPAVLLAIEVRSRGSAKLPRADRWLVRAWVVHYIWLLLNSQIAIRTHINAGVILWTTVTLMLISRAARPAAAEDFAEDQEPQSEATRFDIPPAAAA